MTYPRLRNFCLTLFACFLLFGCSGGATSFSHSQKPVAPEGFQIKDTGQWDGTLYRGGIWVTHPAASEPERVVIRNSSTGRETVGALYPGEKEDSPPIRLSSDAAQALGLRANRRTSIHIVAEHGSLLQSNVVRNQDAVGSTPPQTVVGANSTNTAQTTSRPAPALSKSAPSRSIRPAMAPQAVKSRLQIAVFSNRANAERAVRSLRDRGVPAQVRQVSRGTTVMYNVDTPPIRTGAALSRLLSLARVLGFRDAYATLP